MGGGFFWSDGWSWNGSIPILDWWSLPVVAIAALYIVLALTPSVMSGVASVMRRLGSSGSALIWWRSNT